MLECSVTGGLRREAKQPDLTQAGWLEQQLRCPAHLVRSFGSLPDGRCPMKCIGCCMHRRKEDGVGDENFGAAEAKCVERKRLRVLQFVRLLASDGIKNESRVSNFF